MSWFLKIRQPNGYSFYLFNRKNIVLSCRPNPASLSLRPEDLEDTNGLNKFRLEYGRKMSQKWQKICRMDEHCSIRKAAWWHHAGQHSTALYRLNIFWKACNITGIAGFLFYGNIESIDSLMYPKNRKYNCRYRWRLPHHGVHNTWLYEAIWGVSCPVF